MPILPLTYGPKNFLQAFKVMIDKINEIVTGLNLVGPSTQTAWVFYQKVSEVAGTIAANNGKALFANGGGTDTSFLPYVPASGDIIVSPTGGGIYTVAWSISGAEPNAFGVFVNGAIQFNSIFGSGAGTQQNSGFAGIEVVAGDIINIRSVDCPAAITLQLAGTTNPDQVVCALLLEKKG